GCTPPRPGPLARARRARLRWPRAGGDTRPAIEPTPCRAARAWSPPGAAAPRCPASARRTALEPALPRAPGRAPADRRADRTAARAAAPAGRESGASELPTPRVRTGKARRGTAEGPGSMAAVGSEHERDGS